MSHHAIPGLPAALDTHRNGRAHRFMESADINGAFREVFKPLRSNIRHGLSNTGQVYALEMDVCIPGAMLASEWIPLASYGIDESSLADDPAQRRRLYRQLLALPRAEALIAFVCEVAAPDGPMLLVEIASIDGCHRAEFPIVPGRGWHQRELLSMPHRKVDDADDGSGGARLN